MMKKLIVLILFLRLVGSVNALVANGDFEADGTNWGVIPAGWTADFNAFGQVWLPYTGVASMHPGGGGAVGGVYQDLTTVIGESYDVSMWVQNFDYFVGVGGQVKILAGSAGTDTYTFENGLDVSILYSTAGLVDQNFLTNEDGSWSQVSFQFTAIDTTTRFGIYSNPVEPISIDVDDVSVTAVPEPTTLALLGLGGLLLRKRR
jgi:hypothetical protein